MGVPEGADLQSTPLSPPEKHFIRYRLDSLVRADGSLSGRVELTAEGQSDSNLRRIFSRNRIGQWPGELQKEFFRLHPAVRVRDLEFPDPYDISKPMRISFGIEIPGYMKKGSSIALVRPLAAFLPFQSVLAFLNLDTALAERKYPFRLRSSQQVEISESMKISGARQPLSLPSLQKVSGSGAAF